MKIGFGVDLGGTSVKLAAFTPEGELLSKWEIPTVLGHDGGQILPDIAASVLDYCEKKYHLQGRCAGYWHWSSRSGGQSGRGKRLRESGLGRVQYL